MLDRVRTVGRFTAIVLASVGSACGRISFDDTGDANVDANVDAGRDPTLIGYWSFDGNVSDASGNGHDAIPQNVDYAAGFIGQGLSLGGIDSYASVPSLDASVFGAGDLTISLCVSVATNLSGFDMPFFMGGSSASNSGIDIELGTGGWGATVNDGDGAADVFLKIGDETLTGTGMHCFAAKVDRIAGAASVYLDGTFVLGDTSATLGSFPAGGETLRFGGNNAGNYPLVGVVDEVRIYSRALTDDEIRALHTQ